MRKTGLITAIVLCMCIFCACSPKQPSKADTVSLEEVAKACAQVEVWDQQPMQYFKTDVGALYFEGFNEYVITGYSECYMFGPMLAPFPFIGYVFRVAEGVDVDEFKSDLEQNCVPDWNVCTSADTVICKSESRLVLFVMLSQEKSPGAADRIVSAFQNILN